MRFVALITLLALSSAHADELEDSANKPQIIHLEYGDLTVGEFDNGQHDEIHVGSGTYINDPAAIILSKKLKGLEAENAYLKAKLDATPPPTTSTWLLVSSIALGVLLGGAAVMVVKH